MTDADFEHDPFQYRYLSFVSSRTASQMRHCRRRASWHTGCFPLIDPALELRGEDEVPVTSNVSPRAFAASSTERLDERATARRWTRWAGKGALAMGTLAVLALAVTVLFAQHALDDATDVVIRGDGDTLVSGVVVDLWEAKSLTPETLTSVLDKHKARQLRYVGLIDRQDHHVMLEAGTATIAKASYMPGETLRRGQRVRLVALIPPRAETRAATQAAGAPEGPSLLQPYPRPYLLVEFEPPVIERLQGVLLRTAVVATVAALVLMAFAVAWSRATARLSAVQHQVESERRLVALGRASTVIAHELRNPLAALKGHAQLLVEDLAEPSRSKATRVVDGAERLERLMSMLLDFVRDGPLDIRAVSPAVVDHGPGLGPGAEAQVLTACAHPSR
jgi:hypothetical protein